MPIESKQTHKSRQFRIALKVLLALVFFGIVLHQARAQQFPIESTKGDLDGSISVGPCFPYGTHKFDEYTSNTPMRFALPGITYTAQAHADFGNTWKVGVGFQNYEAKIDKDGITDYLITTIDTNNYFLTIDQYDSPYYSSIVFSADIEKDITYGKFRLSPHANVGFSSSTMSLYHDFMLKERGSNYAMSIAVTSSDIASISLIFLAGLKAGVIVPFDKNEFYIYVGADFIKYRSTMALNYTTSDIYGNTAYNQYWFTDGIAYIGTMLGVSYYLR